VIARGAPTQDRLTEHTVRRGAGQPAHKATIRDVAWLAGRWTGTSADGFSEETWSPPTAGSMVGVYRLVKNGRPVFYELMTFVEDNDSVVLRLKHFDGDLTGWEDKNRSVSFELVATDDTGVRFEGLTYQKDGPNRLTVYLAQSDRNGAKTEETFRFTRADSGKGA
jgi:hypothetical protein